MKSKLSSDEKDAPTLASWEVVMGTSYHRLLWSVFLKNMWHWDFAEFLNEFIRLLKGFPSLKMKNLTFHTSVYGEYYGGTQDFGS